MKALGETWKMISTPGRLYHFSANVAYRIGIWESINSGHTAKFANFHLKTEDGQIISRHHYLCAADDPSEIFLQAIDREMAVALDGVVLRQS